MVFRKLTVGTIVWGVMLSGGASVANAGGAAEWLDAGQRDPERARELLRLASDALKNVQTLQAEVEVGATEGFAAYLPAAKGTLVVGRIVSDGGPRRVLANPFEFRFTGKGKVTGNAESELAFDAVYRDRRYEWMNDEERQQRIRFERVAGRDNEIRLAKSFLFDQLFSENPLDAQLKSEQIELADTKVVDGVPCEGVRIPTGSAGRFTVYYIPRTDFIPRRIEQGVAGSASPISGTEFKELRKVRVNEALASNAFEVALLPGYSEDPNPARVRPVQATPSEGEVNPNAIPRRPLATPFELSDDEGKPVKLSDFQGRVVVLDFWGTWLPDSARQGMDVLKAVQEHFEDGPVACVGLNFRERDREKAVAYFREKGYTYTLLLGADDVARSYGVRQFPTIYIIGFDGEIIEVVNGYKEDATVPAMIETIEKYLAERATEKPAGTGAAAGG